MHRFAFWIAVPYFFCTITIPMVASAIYRDLATVARAWWTKRRFDQAVANMRAQRRALLRARAPWN